MSHPDHLLHALTARQWQDWIEFTSVDPIGEERADYRTAVATAGLAACWVEKVETKNYMVDWWKATPPPASLEDKLRFMFASRDAFFAGKQKHG